MVRPHWLRATQDLKGKTQLLPPALPDRLRHLVIVLGDQLDMESTSLQVIQGCIGLGIGFSLDDFGTGYSSLTYLKVLPAQVIKIDQSFVRGMTFDASDRAIVEGIIGLASAFGRSVVAEGVESESTGAQLIALGCEAAQGYAIARPMPPEDLLAFEARKVWICRMTPHPCAGSVKLRIAERSCADGFTAGAAVQFAA